MHAAVQTFYLWYHLRASGISELVRQRVLSDDALYVGQSAGSIVAGCSMSTAQWNGWDDPRAAPEADWNARGSLDAMALASNTSFFPHFSADWKELVESKRAALGHTCVCLTDEGEAYILGDDNGDDEGGAGKDDT